MATIELYANKINQMPGLIKDIKKSVTNYKSELSALKTKSLTINKSVCNLDDIINSIQTSSQTQEQKITSLDTFNNNSEEFISDAVRIDGDAAEIIKKRKDDFYDKYNYLKPECEKSGWEKFCNGCESVGEWCKEHWVTIVTVLVVIAIAVLAVVTFGVALAAVAAIAGIISLVLCAADVICMIATGGKDLATVFRENGWNVLADIFQGISIGCDIVSIAFPAGAAIKAMAKVGVKTFAKASFEAVKIAFRGAIDDVFKSGFKNGLKNLGKIAFKTFIFDIDDLTRMENGSRVWNLKAEPLTMQSPNKHWIISGDQFIPNPDTIPGKFNPDGLSMEEILGKYGVGSIPMNKNGTPDFSNVSVADVPISMKNLEFDVEGVLSGQISNKEFSDLLRDINYANAETALPEGTTLNSLKEQFGVLLTPHEDLSMKRVFYVPSEIHGNLGHTGGIGNYKFNFLQIPDISRLVGDKITQFGFRFGSESVAGAATGN
ncbi:hypothetical protein CLHUN_40960 [Ruminiclostridium hungatei]|uniref:Uncharacterized protein n=1 Tax=Ruminiclostridium hungatei TaxID=48256 RepID=A0A1V4SFJ0_RUMHU|nr:hypothetical protein [Ruminiclostridium hungatei]OPX42037.1 hypothetical protein CLHUN_40960 [Ruminiclostridium hungatei]